MGAFLLWSLIASVALTILFNLLLILFPDAMNRTERFISKLFTLSNTEPRSDLHAILPVRVMIIGSLAMTLLANFALLILS